MEHDAFVCEIRCPVHGFIGLTDLERTIVDTSAFQRLRRIKQLAWTDYVYPGASHSRFEHSLGVMHLAGKLFESVVTTSGSVLRDLFGYTNAGLSRDWQIVRLAALLHDVGHAPFSHATEHLLPLKKPEHYALFPEIKTETEQYSHEDYSVAIIKNILAEYIEQHPGNRRNYQISADDVTALISHRAEGKGSLFWKDIISGQLDADRMDYLLRDSLHAGVSYGKFDLDRIVSSICIVPRPDEPEEPKIAIMRGGAYAAEALIIARYWMHKQVYFHKTRLACNFHLEAAVTDILMQDDGSAHEKGYYPRPDSVSQLEEFLKWDDYRVMGLLANGLGGEHGKRLMSRNHYRLVCELEQSDATLDELSESISRNNAVISMLGSLIKHVAQPKTLWYKTRAINELVLVNDDGKQQVGYFSGYSSLMKSINLGSFKFVYADKPDVAAAKKKYEEFLENETRERTNGSLSEIVPEVENQETKATAESALDPQLTLDGIVKSVKSELPSQKGAKDVV